MASTRPDVFTRTEPKGRRYVLRSRAVGCDGTGVRHRAPSVPDLLIAATAELAELTLLHVDKDFDLIADVTGQPIERLDVG